MPSGSSNTLGSFVPTTNVWDTNEIYSTDVTSPEFKELLVRLYQNLNIIALNVNIRDAGYYHTQEFINGQLYFPNPSYSSGTPVVATFRPVYRKVFNCGPLLDNSAGLNPQLLVPHNLEIQPGWTFTRIYGTATFNNMPTTFSAIPIPNVSTTLPLGIMVDDTDIVIDFGMFDYSAYTFVYVVLEYLKT